MEPAPVSDFRFVGARRRLIEDIRARGIEDLAILSLFDRVSRHDFLPEGVQPRAYEDAPLPIGYGQTASQPSLQAFYLHVLQPQPTEKVLEVGTGCGFLTALLSLMADRVYSVERIRELSQRARVALDRIGVKNVALHIGDGSIGWRKYAPYDVILVSAASPSVPQALVDQLAEGGRLLIPVGTREVQDLILVRKVGGEVSEEKLRDRYTFVPLLGEQGWQDSSKGSQV